MAGKKENKGSEIANHTIEANFTCGHELVITHVKLSRSSPHVDCPYCYLDMVRNKVLEEPDKYDNEMHKLVELFEPMLKGKE